MESLCGFLRRGREFGSLVTFLVAASARCFALRLHSMTVRAEERAAVRSAEIKAASLLSDTKLGEFELYMEVDPYWCNDSGLLFRAAEGGAGYPIALDDLDGGAVGAASERAASTAVARRGLEGRTRMWRW